jgi:hypothetical protein
VYLPADVDTALARVFGPGVRPLQLKEAVFEAMLDGWRAQQTARYLKPKTIQHNERGVRLSATLIAFRGSGAPATSMSTSRICCRGRSDWRARRCAPQWRLKGFSEYVCDRRYPWTVIGEREFGRAPGRAV